MDKECLISLLAGVETTLNDIDEWIQELERKRKAAAEKLEEIKNALLAQRGDDNG